MITTSASVDHFAQVDVPGAGLVSMATLGQLRTTLGNLREQVAQMQAGIRDADSRIEDALADLGALLVPRRAWWTPSTDFHPWLEEADRLVARITQLDQQIGRGEPGQRTAAAAAVLRLAGRITRRDTARERARAAARLRQILVETASWATTTAPAVAKVPDAEALVAEVFELQTHVGKLRAACAAAEGQLSAIAGEVHARDEAARQMGFDALHLAAHFRAYGLPAVETPAGLAPGEVAHLCVGAAVARGATGVRLPGVTPAVAHTGARFWLGTFRSGPMPPLAPIDSGSLTVSNRFLHFTGASEAFATPLDNLVEVDVYADAVGVVALGRESMDFYRVAAPRQVVFYVNWAQEARSQLA
ncbi:MAG TPA: hypothetical protein VKK19_01325 [Candidatus Dormibacteraeota bacterium]|nr:hypothetical protein [Candidatus Dormibacteraeota bacterium]